PLRRLHRQPHPLRRRGGRCRRRRDRRRPHRPAHLPSNPYNDIAESDTAELYPALLRALSPLDLAYLHVMHAGDDALLSTLRALWPTRLILNRAGTDLPTRAKDIDHGTADLVSVGALALANPDLVERLRSDAPLNTPDPATFYGGGVAGYTDYPTHTVCGTEPCPPPRPASPRRPARGR